MYTHNYGMVEAVGGKFSPLFQFEIFVSFIKTFMESNVFFFCSSIVIGGGNC